MTCFCEEDAESDSVAPSSPATPDFAAHFWKLTSLNSGIFLCLGMFNTFRMIVLIPAAWFTKLTNLGARDANRAQRLLMPPRRWPGILICTPCRQDINRMLS